MASFNFENISALVIGGTQFVTTPFYASQTYPNAPRGELTAEVASGVAGPSSSRISFFHPGNEPEDNAFRRRLHIGSEIYLYFGESSTMNGYLGLVTNTLTLRQRDDDGNDIDVGTFSFQTLGLRREPYSGGMVVGFPGVNEIGHWHSATYDDGTPRTGSYWYVDYVGIGSIGTFNREGQIEPQTFAIYHYHFSGTRSGLARNVAIPVGDVTMLATNNALTGFYLRPTP